MIYAELAWIQNVIRSKRLLQKLEVVQSLISGSSMRSQTYISHNLKSVFKKIMIGSLEDHVWQQVNTCNRYQCRSVKWKFVVCSKASSVIFNICAKTILGFFWPCQTAIQTYVHLSTCEKAGESRPAGGYRQT